MWKLSGDEECILETVELETEREIIIKKESKENLKRLDEVLREKG